MILHQTIKRYSLLFVLFAATITIFGSYGFQGDITRDDAIYIYSGQRMAEGIPPYVSIFDHKGPLAPIFSGFGAILAKFLPFDDIQGIRLVFFLLSSLSIGAVYLLVAELTRSVRAGFFSAITFLSFHGFALHAASGPQAKTPMVLFEILCFLFTARKKWFWGGFFGSLSFLVWQPCAIFPLATLMIAAFQPHSERFRASIKTSFGILIPIFFVSAYFIYNKAFYDFLDGMILFNVLHLTRDNYSILHHILLPVNAVQSGYSFAFIPIILGLAIILLLYFYRKQQSKSWKKTFTNDRFSVILLTYPFPFIWSFLDFQSYPDFYVFLPYAALGFGILIDAAFQRLHVDLCTDKFVVRSLPVILIVPLLMVPIIDAKNTRNNGLELQRKSAIEIKERFGDDVKLISIGAPELLVLLNRPNPNRYVFIISGIDSYIDSKYADGFDGFLKEIQEYSPDVIAVGTTNGSQVQKLMHWVVTNYTKENIGVFEIYVRRKDSPNKANAADRPSASSDRV